MMWTIATDIDGTLTGDPMGLVRLAKRLEKKRAAGNLFLILSTGRRLDEVVMGIANEGLPKPDVVICQVGTEIYLPPFGSECRPMEVWREKMLNEYCRAQAERFLDSIDGLVMQPDRYNTELKTSCYLDQCPNPEEAARVINGRVEPYRDRYQVVWSSGRDLDILPTSAGKGKAIRFLAEHQGLDTQQLVVAGDTGNDADMFEEFAKGVVVANAQPELTGLAQSLTTERIYLAQRPFAAGVEEGLEHFGVLDSTTLL